MHLLPPRLEKFESANAEEQRKQHELAFGILSFSRKTYHWLSLITTFTWGFRWLWDILTDCIQGWKRRKNWNPSRPFGTGRSLQQVKQHTLCLLEFIADARLVEEDSLQSHQLTTFHPATLQSLQNVFQDQVGKNATSERQEVFIEKETPCIFNKWLKKTIRTQKKDEELCMWSKRQYHHCEEKEGLNESSRNNAPWNKSTFKIHHCGDGLWYNAGFQLRLLRFTRGFQPSLLSMVSSSC